MESDNKNSNFWFCSSEITSEDVLKFEKKINIQLPPEYRKHIIDNNGGNPYKSYYKEYRFVRFYSIRYGDELLSSTFNKIKDKIPNGYLPFTYDPDYNEFCINTKEGEEYGFIYMILTDEDENPLPDKEPILVAKSFNEVLNNLQEHPSE